MRSISVLGVWMHGPIFKKICIFTNFIALLGFPVLLHSKIDWDQHATVNMAFLLCVFSSILFINPLVNALEFANNHDPRITCIKSSHVLHINLGNSDSSQNVTPVQKCRGESNEQGGKISRSSISLFYIHIRTQSLTTI